MNRFSKLVLAGTLCAALAAAAGSASAALVKYSLEDLARRSSLIVCGEVVDVTCSWQVYEKLGVVIVTDVTVRVSETWRGTAGEEITVRYFGGTVGEEWQLCLESPVYEKGEKVLVFARPWLGGRLWTTGWLQGKYRLIDGEGGTHVRGDPKLPITATQPLTAVRDQVRKLVATLPSAPSGAASGEAGSATGASGASSADAGPAARK